MVSAPMKRWKSRYITHSDGFRNRNQPIDSAREAENSCHLGGRLSTTHSPALRIKVCCTSSPNLERLRQGFDKGSIKLPKRSFQLQPLRSVPFVLSRR